jgi:hypothetical protein
MGFEERLVGWYEECLLPLTDDFGPTFLAAGAPAAGSSQDSSVNVACAQVMPRRVRRIQHEPKAPYWSDNVD